jgi:hypothetical protein
VALAFAGACASPGLPAGGPISRKPLVLLKVTPDTNSLNVKARSVVFQFDKVVRETDKLNQLVTISPSDGPPSVDWSRYTLVVHPYKPWRANTAYTVTILPGLADLFGNSTTKPFQTVFSTGKEIPQGAVFGVAFDWAEYRVASGARIEAMVGSDTILRYVATSDSSGRFALRHLPAGDLRLRVFIDENKNGILDRREKWDSVSVSLTDSARHDFYAFSHDSAGPSLGEGTGVTDSLTVHVRFTQPLSPNVPFDTSNLRLRLLTKDSSLVAIRGVFVAVTHDSVETARKNFVADSMMRADTSAKGRAKVLAADSARAQALRFAQSQAQIANVRNRRDSAKKVPPPTLNRPKPVSDFVIELMQPLADSSRMMLTATGVSNIAGSTRTSSRPVSWFKPKVTKQDSTATKPPAARPRPPANP